MKEKIRRFITVGSVSVALEAIDAIESEPLAGRGCEVLIHGVWVPLDMTAKELRKEMEG